jgi:hypothetical protein
MKTSELTGTEILKREVMAKKLEIFNKLDCLDEALNHPQKYSHIRLREDQYPLIEEWYVARAMDLLGIDKESAEKEYSWFILEN